MPPIHVPANSRSKCRKNMLLRGQKYIPKIHFNFCVRQLSSLKNWIKLEKFSEKNYVGEEGRLIFSVIHLVRIIDEFVFRRKISIYFSFKAPPWKTARSRGSKLWSNMILDNMRLSFKYKSEIAPRQIYYSYPPVPFQLFKWI